MTRKKTRPQPGDPVTAGMSERDIAATGIMSRRQIQTCKAIANIPEDEFERLIESDKPPTTTALLAISRGRKPARRQAKCCPHCGAQLRKTMATQGDPPDGQT